MKRLAILGSTGSIGTQALDVVDANPHLFSIKVLTAYNNVKLLIIQALKYKPKTVVIANDEHYDELCLALEMEGIEVMAGSLALQQVVLDDDIDMVVAAMVGYAGLLPVINAIKAKKEIALANKETLVVAGELITRLCAEYNVNLLPVDSEHSAIYQCLEGERKQDIEKIILTCSGGPFRTFSLSELEHVKSKQALAHPNWNMGAKITIDSATLMNKGFEVIEAKWLFGIPASQIEVVIHPQSIIHSLVQFTDGAIKAQMGLPDMRLPIHYAMCYPGRVGNSFPRFRFTDYPELTFHKPDTGKFRNLTLVYQAIEKGGNMACIVNAANEIAVDAFLNDRIRFLQMPEMIEQCMQNVTFISHPLIDDYIQTDNETRQRAREIVKQMS
ncbi:MAG: 1-deoxy-D-xylulose-5-phosphate reductoisomerase [Prolixibacteraceae bacterium]|nr:1-deoxy-D-xylulose-5-phosphate reductoisomerase [Prolixibacteraceae bacterium]MBN2649318.1 1-deoxy-D-xylulose-5-phosphate reductoisomerase [Prolixibacteraceae bacterium]